MSRHKIAALALAGALALFGACADNEYSEDETGMPGDVGPEAATAERTIGEGVVEEPGGEEEYGSAVEGVMGEDVDVLEDYEAPDTIEL